MNFTEEARKLYDSLPTIGGNKDHVIIAIATALQAAYESGKAEERERCAKIAESHADDRMGHDNPFQWHDGYQTAAAIREAKP